MGIFNFFKRKQKGCLHDKTHEQKIDFFKSLLLFYENDIEFFNEQFNDLLHDEKLEFYEYVKMDNEIKKSMLSMVKLIGELLHEKHKK